MSPSSPYSAQLITLTKYSLKLESQPSSLVKNVDSGATLPGTVLEVPSPSCFRFCIWTRGRDEGEAVGAHPFSANGPISLIKESILMQFF